MERLFKKMEELIFFIFLSLWRGHGIQWKSFDMTQIKLCADVSSNLLAFLEYSQQSKAYICILISNAHGLLFSIFIF